MMPIEAYFLLKRLKMRIDADHFMPNRWAQIAMSQVFEIIR